MNVYIWKKSSLVKIIDLAFASDANLTKAAVGAVQYMCKRHKRDTINDQRPDNAAICRGIRCTCRWVWNA